MVREARAADAPGVTLSVDVRNQPAWEFARFLKIAEQGHAREPLPVLTGDAALARERADLETSMAFTRKLLNV